MNAMNNPPVNNSCKIALKNILKNILFLYKLKPIGFGKIEVIKLFFLFELQPSTLHLNARKIF